MHELIFIAALLFPSPAPAADLGPLTAADVTDTASAARLPQSPAAQEEKTGDGTKAKAYLLALTGPKSLYTELADTPAKFEEFKTVWLPVILRAGLKPLEPEYSASSGTIKYNSPEKTAIRNFMCDTAHMPLSPAGMEKALLAALREAGIKVLGSFGIPVDPGTFLKPTVDIYYLTAYENDQDREVQLRYLNVNKPGVRLDHDVLENEGIKIPVSYNDHSAFYIGPRIGIALAAANSEDALQKQVSRHKKMIASRGEKLIGVKIDHLDQPVVSEGALYSYLARIYYYK